MNKKIHVLYIDDEDNNLKSFRATLRKDFKIFTAINAEDGLRIAQQEEIHVCIADQRMPGMTGIEFLSKWLRSTRTQSESYLPVILTSPA